MNDIEKALAETREAAHLLAQRLLDLQHKVCQLARPEGAALGDRALQLVALDLLVKARQVESRLNEL